MYISNRIVECLLYVMNELKITSVKRDEAELLAQFLEERGYTSTEIDAVVTWLLDRDDFFPGSIEMLGHGKISRTHRVLSELESSVITPSAHGYLIQLLELGLINEFEFERVLEQVTFSGLITVGVNEIEAIASAVLLETDSIPQGTFYHYDHSVVSH